MSNRVKAKLNGHAAPVVAPSPTVVNGEADKAKSNHDSGGRFTAGNKAACGNPFARRVARLRSVLLDAVSDEDLREVAQGLVRRARCGDAAAAKVLLSYVLGKPQPMVNPDDLDADEWRRLVEQPDLVDVVMTKTNKVEPAVAVESAELARLVNPTADKLAAGGVLEAAGRRLLLEEGVCFEFRDSDGKTVWPPPPRPEQPQP